MSTPLTKTLLQQALDMLEEQALHIEAPMLPDGEELLKRIRAAISQQVEPAQAQGEREAVERLSPTTSVPHCGRASEVEAYMTDDDDGEYMTVAQHERIVAALARPAQTAQLVVPDECPHMIVFDDAERENELFAGCGARSAAMRRWEQISQSWNAHLFVRIERNSRDDRHPNAVAALSAGGRDE